MNEEELESVNAEEGEEDRRGGVGWGGIKSIKEYMKRG